MDLTRFAWLLLSAVAVVAAGCAVGEAAAPELADRRLTMTLVASDPEIVTPIGLAIDARDRLYVLESHTHLPPSDYDGPDADYVKVLEADERGRLRVVGIFAEGFEDGMNLAFSPDGVLHLVTSRSVWALHDRDGDGVSEDRTRLLHMAVPEYVYDHAGLMGIAFSEDGWMYVSRGNVGGQAWRLTGSDGRSLDGYGDGGNIVRARIDGSGLEEMATGFWNPFYLFVDAAGRLMATDNDPDSRGPNRLLHIIEGGDYGYQSLYGGSGIHPYLSWNGELPGTLPYAAGLGEAPTGCVDVSGTQLDNGAGALLCGVWEESAIVGIHLAGRGASVGGRVQTIAQGGDHFRPVAMAAASDGSIYVTDWVLRRYPSHGRGRIWRITGLSRGTATAQPASALDSIYAARGPADYRILEKAFASEDPYVRGAAVEMLSRPVFRDAAVHATSHPDAGVRLGALLALKRARHGDAESIARRLLQDSDPRIRKMTLIWIGQAGMTSLRSEVERIVDEGRLAPEHFETYLATLRHLDPSFVEAFRTRAHKESSSIERKLPDGFVELFVADSTRPASLRAAALAFLEHPSEHVDLLRSLSLTGIPELRTSAIRILSRTGHRALGEFLLGLAADRSNPAVVRAEALLGLPSGAGLERVVAMMHDPEPDVRLEAARHLRRSRLEQPLRRRVAAIADTLSDERAAVQLDLALGSRPSTRPEAREEWVESAKEGGDPEIGRRVFFSREAQCAQCHRVNHIGGDLGPDLTSVGSSKSRAQLARAIVDPSAEIAPDWQGWYVQTSDGRRHYGRQIDVGNDSVELYTLAGRYVEFEDAEEWGVAESSLMPEGLERNLTLHDFRDLVAFLAERK